ncbi:MAG: thiol-disulfide oxidoreductase DCC family protein [Dehalococcoidia bacterium]|tara:strand:+ start:290 stop:703 length:414 start_codon:yes stop_codon:yes gene_type:complete
MLSKDRNIIFFDGYCNLCNWGVNLLLKLDTNSFFIFCSLQSESATNILSTKGFNKNEISDLDNIVLLKQNNIFVKSDAILEICRELSGAYKLLFFLKFIPKFFRDFIYSFIAQNRYKVFGKKSICRVPNKNEITRFI